MRYLCRLSALSCGILLFICAPSAHLASQTIKLERPGPREFVIDRANMLDPSDKSFIQGTCDELLTDHTIPLFVVTIESMGRYSSQSMTIEQFASTLYNQWGIGYLKKDGKPWNKGILLLISQDDRMARIELGAGYGHTKDADCSMIMQDKIVRRFIVTEFSMGIHAGVKALDAMARETEGEVSFSSMFVQSALFIIPYALFGLVLFTVVSFVRTGKRGMAWMMWGILFSFPVSLLSSLGSHRHGMDGDAGWNGGGGDSFSGGSFGDGFSGGGGATGSW
jgi:uncharacterized protein